MKVFSEITFRKMLLPSSNNANDNAAYIYRKYADLDGKFNLGDDSMRSSGPQNWRTNFMLFF